MTAKGTVKFFPNRYKRSSPNALSTSSQEYLSIRQMVSSGARTETRRVKQHPSLDWTGFPLCSALRRPCGRCGGRSDPKISVMYFLSVEWRLLVGLISQTGKWAAVFSETRTWTPLVAFFRTTTTRRNNNRLCGRIAGNWKKKKVNFQSKY